MYKCSWSNLLSLLNVHQPKSEYSPVNPMQSQPKDNHVVTKQNLLFPNIEAADHTNLAGS